MARNGVGWVVRRWRGDGGARGDGALVGRLGAGPGLGPVLVLGYRVGRRRHSESEDVGRVVRGQGWGMLGARVVRGVWRYSAGG